jgi:hypothetical protein
MHKSVNTISEILIKINLFSLGINWILVLFGNVEFMSVVKYTNKPHCCSQDYLPTGEEMGLSICFSVKVSHSESLKPCLLQALFCSPSPAGFCFCHSLAG